MMRPLLLHRQRHSGCGGFTLAELLAVIVIMAIMMGIAVPGLRGLTKSAGLRGATLQVKTALDQARQHAMAFRQDTGVLFPAWANDPKIENGKSYRALAVYSTNYLTDWQFLPAGILVARPNLTPTSATDRKRSIQGLQNGPDGVPYCLINRQGRRNGEFTMLVYDGFVVAGGNIVTKGGGTNVITVRDVLGSVSVRRL
jgi:prepilin-type N-terminal cleavage/methylation domain-containing protein